MNIAFSVREQHRPRSGFSFLPCADGIILHGGNVQVGVMLDDTWLLNPTSKPVSAPPNTTSKAPNKQPKLN
ncbi:hypothetical protein BYT27DRAFT_7193405 [Phlegmacium glaucopus]|nr:hypothetical protein BYT27DRAFT_7193405 [Phlegmacium glaucopus]